MRLVTGAGCSTIRSMLDGRWALQGLVLATAWLAFAGLPARASDCAPWPGEPHPLPRVGEGDRLLVRWAELRAKELARHARALEASAPIEANRVWRHLLCLDPGDEAARSGVQRTRPVRVHRPEILVGSEVAEPPADTDSWSSLDAPVLLAGRAPAPPRRKSVSTGPQRGGSLRQVEGWLSEAEAQVAAARFEEALATSAKARAGLERVPPGQDVSRSRLRVELIDATAEAARGRDAAARACFVRVLALDPAFALDARTTSPKLMRLLDAARAETGVSR
jgi:hypothetical protein